MARNRFIKTKSNFVIKELHQSTNIGNIYERDWMTIADLNSYAPGSLPAYGLNGFKMVINSGVSLKKKHHFGSWVKNESCGNKTLYWTAECMNEDGVDNSSGTPLKPNLNSVLDFACYGSSTKMIETTITHIINYFPGELFLTDEKININGITYYLVDNPFDIEMDRVVNINDNKKSSLRIFGNSYENYIFIDKNESINNKPLSWGVNYFNNGVFIVNGEIYEKCLSNEDKLSKIDIGKPFGEDKASLFLYYVVYNGKKTLVHDGTYIGGRIAPNNKVKKDYFNNLLSFEKVLLNKKTNYTAILETPKETERGNVLQRKTYTWPKAKYGNWNIDVSSNAFYDYFDSLLAIGEFYDQYFSNNIWRSMTHEAIINFDWTHASFDGDGVIDEMDTPHSERIQLFINVAGRMFDDLKQYIDGIGNVNAITYDECNNKPDSQLKEELDNYGWAVKSPLSLHLSKFIGEPLYPNHVEGYSIAEANNEFFRRLSLNSKAILSAKGTKRSIEMIMAMFGYYSLNFIEHSYHDVKRDGKIKTLKWDELKNDEKKHILRYTYDMSEYVYVANEDSILYGSLDDSGKTSEEIIADVKSYNKNKMTYDYENSDEYQGLPIREVAAMVQGDPVYWTNNGQKEIHHYTTKLKSYLIPWFDKNAKYDADTYFESKGGWGLKQTAIGRFGENDDVIIDTTDNLKVYDETVKYLKFVNTLEELTYVTFKNPHINDVYYVYDLTGGEDYDWGYLTVETINENDGSEKLTPEPMCTMSHYFILKDIENLETIGVLRDYDGNVQLIDENIEYGEDGVIRNLSNNSIVDELGFPVKKYGWKNVSEEEIKRGESSDAKRIYYLESIIETNEGNNPHTGNGIYDEGNTYKQIFTDIFSWAKENDNFMTIDDSELPPSGANAYGFNLVKEIDNVKTWYFEDTLETDNQLLYLDTETHQNLGKASNTVGDMQDFVRWNSHMIDESTDYEIEELFNNKQYKIMEPYNMESEDGDISDEAAANSIVNSKHFYIEFMPDMVSPDSMYDFIENCVMFYAKQVIPSTTILKYYVPMRDMDVNCSHRTYLQSVII